MAIGCGINVSQLRREKGASMGVILDGSGKPMEAVGKGSRWPQRLQRGKTWTKAIWAIIVALGTGMGAIATWITYGEAIKRAVWGEALSPSDFTSSMSDQEAAEVVSRADKTSDSVDKATEGAGLVLPDVPVINPKSTPAGRLSVRDEQKAVPPAKEQPVVSPDMPMIAQNSEPGQEPSVKEGPAMAPPAPNPPLDPARVVKRQSARPVLPAPADPFEVTSITYDDRRQLLDVTFRNTTDYTVLISQFVVTLNYVQETSRVEVSGTHDLGPLAKLAKRAREKRRPLSFRVGINAAHKVEPKGVDRHMFKCDLTPKDLYAPETGGHYVIGVYVKCNKDQVVRDRRFVRINGNKMYFVPAR